MILLRCLSILIGGIVLFAAPFLLLPDSPQSASDSRAVLAGCASILLCASGFFFVGIAGHRMKRSRRLRSVAAALLSFPFIAGAWVMLSGEQPELLWAVGPLLFLAAALFIAFVYPAARHRSYRPMRPRELLDHPR
jgi:peptidoglycan/LPS O-acetylase OafA/YrhL